MLRSTKNLIGEKIKIDDLEIREEKLHKSRGGGQSTAEAGKLFK